jgi:hypothetical protein
MTAVEKLHFKIELSSTYWKKVPKYSVFFNDKIIVDRQQVSVLSGESFFVEFDQEVEEDTDCKLVIRLENKSSADTVLNTEKTEIIRDLLLHVKKIQVDDIDLAYLTFTKSYFDPDNEEPRLDKCLDLGLSGSWCLEFQSPFYIWLLENI